MITIDNMNILAHKYGGKCLSSAYSDQNTKLKWECKNGHVWEACSKGIRDGHWCPKCAGRGFTIKDMNDFAKSKGGKCLSLEYIGSRKSLKWECLKGHTWTSSYYWAQRTWCAECNQIEKNKSTLEEMRNIARKRHGKCLSEEYHPNKKLKWECKQGHIWEAVGFKIKRGNWCAICSGKQKFSVKYLQQTAKNRGGRVVSDRYVDAHSKILWECAYGHRWEARLCDIKNHKSWCPFCTGKKTIEHMQKWADKYKGECLSEKYVNSRTELKWKCKIGHIFWKTPQIVQRGGFCPECSSFESEQFCREIFEELFGQEFPKKWPKWLKRYDTGVTLQLDGYCENLKIAFEHNGLQHYKMCDRFHMSKKDLLDVRYRDDVKIQRCKEKGIFLIIIPQLGVKIHGLCVTRDNLRIFILDELRRMSYNFPIKGK